MTVSAITPPPADFVGTSGASTEAPGEPAPASSEPVAPAVDPTPAAPEAQAPAADAAPEVDPFDSAPDDAKFDKSYVKKLREEAAAARVKAKEASEKFGVFAQYDDESQAVWTDLASTFLEDPVKAAEKMKNIVAAIEAGATPAEAQAAVEKVEADPTQVLTPKAVQEMIEKAQQEWQAERDLQVRTDAIIKQAEGLGYKPGSANYVALFHIAQTQTGGDLGKAHEVIQAERQAMIDEAFAKKAGTAGPTPVNQGAAPGTRQVPKSWGDVTAAIMAGEGARPGQ